MHVLRLICRPEQVDSLSGDLWEAGTEGVQEIGFGEAVELIAGFEDASRGPALLARFVAFQPEWEPLPATDWVAHTHAAWPPREIGSRLILTPPWFDAETERVRVVHNPGLASGTGEHPCTQLMLEALERTVFEGARVLDIGAGSGILAIAALRLGAAFACGIDIDEEALQTARENFALNALHPCLIAGSADCLANACADIVLANISGTVLLSLFDDLLRIAKPGARIILSGFTEYELRSFVELLPGAFVTSRNGWRCVSAPV